MADFLSTVDSDRGPEEPIPVTIVSGGAEVNLSGLSGGTVVAATMATGQIAVGTSATLVVAARANRKSVTLVATSQVAFFIGNTGVTVTTGMPAGTSITLATTAAVYAVAGSAVTIGYVELYA